MLTTYNSFLTRILTPARLLHSQGVMQVMGELAEVYGLDRETALATGLLHDAAKDLTKEEQEQMVREGRIEIHPPCEQDYNLYLHGPVGAYFVKKELGITDPVILDAIAVHTWCDVVGADFGHPMAWCLRFADMLEPYRKWDGKAHVVGEALPRLRELAYGGQMKAAAVFQADVLIRFFSENGASVHPNYYLVLKDLKGLQNL